MLQPQIYNCNDVLRFEDAESAMDYLVGGLKNKNRNSFKMPDLILLDIKLPGMSGFEMLRKLKANPSTKRTPVIFLTTSDHDEDIAKSYDYGVNSYVVKPMGFDKFQKKLAEIKIIG